MVVRRVFTILSATAFVATLAAQDAGRTTPAAPEFEKALCPFTADAKVLEQVHCGYVVVPENRSAPKGRRLRLAVAIVKSLSPTPRPDPVVILGGGPGNKVVDRAPAVVMSGEMDALRADRDVIFYDQRGTGFSEPEFCPELSTEWRGQEPGNPGTETPGGGPAARRAHQRQWLARCGDHMRRAGYDLSQYNSEVSAHDLQDLRRALGYEEWNLRAASYGTRLALVAMRVAPQGIRSAVLDSPQAPNRAKWFNLPADFVDVVHRLSAACAAQPACNAAFPDVEQTFSRTMEDLTRKPEARRGTRPNGMRATVIMTGSSFAARVYGVIDLRQGQAVPMVIHALRAGDEAVLAPLRRAFSASRPDEDATSWGLHYTVQCFEEAPLNTADQRERMQRTYPAALTDGGVFVDPSNCEGLHPFRAGPEQTVMVESKIPALIFTAEFDLQTHRSNGTLVAASLKNSQLAEIPGGQHVESFKHACTRTMMRDFFSEPLRTIDMSCLKSIPPLQFVTDVKAISK